MQLRSFSSCLLSCIISVNTTDAQPHFGAGYFLILRILRFQLRMQNCTLSASIHEATCRSALQIKTLFN